MFFGTCCFATGLLIDLTITCTQGSNLLQPNVGAVRNPIRADQECIRKKEDLEPFACEDYISFALHGNLHFLHLRSAKIRIRLDYYTECLIH